MEILQSDINFFNDHWEQNNADAPLKSALKRYNLAGRGVPDVLYINGKVYIHKRHKNLVPHIIKNFDVRTLKMKNPNHWFGSSWGSKIRARIKQIGDRLGDVLKSAAFSPLLPFKGVMKRALRAKGIKPSRRFGDMSLQFYNHIVKGGSHYDTNHFAPVVAIIPPIIKFVQETLMKAKAGAQLTPSEKIVASGSAKILTQVQEQALKAGIDLTDPNSVAKADAGGGLKDDSSKSSGFELSMPMMIGGGVVLLILVVMMLRK